jgi:hypothetical protein
MGMKSTNYPFISLFNKDVYKDESGENTALFPYVNTPSITRYGVRKFCEETMFPFLNKKDQENGISNYNLCRNWQKKLIEWYGNLVRCKSGTIVIRGFSQDQRHLYDNNSKISITQGLIINSSKNKSQFTIGKDFSYNFSKEKSIDLSDHITIGNNVHIYELDELYHLEGFSTEWSAPGSSTTMLTLTRGVYCGVSNDGKLDNEFLYFDDVKDKDQADITTNITFDDTILDSEKGNKD